MDCSRFEAVKNFQHSLSSNSAWCAEECLPHYWLPAAVQPIDPREGSTELKSWHLHTFIGIPSCLLNSGGKGPRLPRTHDMKLTCKSEERTSHQNPLLESHLNLCMKGWFSSALFLFQVAAGEVEIQGGIYDLETGHVEFLGQSPAQNILMKSGATFPAVLRPVQHQASVPQVAPAQVLAAPVQYRAQRFTYVLPATTRVVQAPAAPAYLQPAQAAPVPLVQTTWHGVQGNRFIWADRLARGKFCNFTKCRECSWIWLGFHIFGCVHDVPHVHRRQVA